MFHKYDAMNNISISAKTTTYGRVDMLEEALHSFLIQEYNGESEMVIINDYPLQTLHFNHPRVRIINLKETFPVIGEKENFAIEQCKYDTIYNCDDDDVFLPNHFQNINKYFPGNHLLHWNRSVAMVSHKIASIRNIGNCGIVYDREFVRKIGGYPRNQAGADMDLVVGISNKGGRVARVMPPEDEVSQIYNWGNGSYHLSGQGRDHAGRENIIARHSNHIEQLRKQGKIPTGDIYLKPHWNRNYIQMLKDFNQKTPDQKKINYNNLNGWSIGEELLNNLLTRLPKGSTVLEFGSGKGTIELAKFYDVISVDHNEKWQGLTDNATYIHAPLIDGWYNMEPVYEAIKSKDIKTIILDGPPGSGNRKGFLEHLPKIGKRISIIVDDTNRAAEAKTAKDISKIVGRKCIEITGHQKKFTLI